MLPRRQPIAIAIASKIQSFIRIIFPRRHNPHSCFSSSLVAVCRTIGGWMFIASELLSPICVCLSHQRVLVAHKQVIRHTHALLHPHHSLLLGLVSSSLFTPLRTVGFPFSFPIRDGLIIINCNTSGSYRSYKKFNRCVAG